MAVGFGMFAVYSSVGYTLSMADTAYTAAQASALDKYAQDALGILAVQLMEVAGLRCAEAARQLLPTSGRVVVLGGPGGNGGDGLTCAKWLHLWGYDVTVVSSHPVERFRDLTAELLATWKALGGKVAVYPPEAKDVDLIIDSLFGTSLQGNPTGRAAELIEWSNQSGKPVLSIDVPSGLDATTGQAHTPCIRATHTVVLGVWKTGVVATAAAQFVGKTQLVDIGLPRTVPSGVLP